MKITNKPWIKNSVRENIYLFVKKYSEADNRLIDYQYNTPANIILKTNDLNIEKIKNQTNLDVGLSGFIRSKGNLDVASKIYTKSSFVQIREEKYSKKIMKKINVYFTTTDYNLLLIF